MTETAPYGLTNDGLPRLAYTLREVSRATGIGEQRLRRLARDGELPFVKVGATWVMDAREAHQVFKRKD